MSARLLKRIVCFHSDVDFGVTTHLAVLPLGEYSFNRVTFDVRVSGVGGWDWGGH